MPKERASKTLRLSKLVKEYGDAVFSTDGQVLFCKLCEKSVNFDKKHFVTQHCDTQRHKNNMIKKESGPSTSSARLLSACISSKQSQFSMDLCGALMSADIPLHKVENPTFKAFLEKYSKEPVPSESSLRKAYVDLNYEQTIAKIRDAVGEHYIWVSIDEMTDAMGRYVANTIVGTLDAENGSQIFLINSECLAKTNSSSVAQALTNSLTVLWPLGVKYERVLLLVTDAAAYMRKAASALQILFPNMLFLTCLAHALHRIAEEVRAMFPEVDKLISNAKKVFLKAPSRVACFREECPEIPLPPAPILTRWGTWIEAAIYYSKNFEPFCSVMEKIDDEDAVSVEVTKGLLRQEAVRHDLAFISCHFSQLPVTIQRLEERGIPLTESMRIFQEEAKRMKAVPGQKGVRINAKLDSVLQRNSQFEIIRNISLALGGNDVEMDLELSPTILSCYKYAPVTSVDVERSFSRFKNILADNRQSFTFDALKKFVVVNCNFQHQ